MALTDEHRGWDWASDALIQVVDAALAEAARKSGDRLACRPGCTACCMGPFPISQLDALRLREGLARLEERDAVRAARLRQRVRDSASRLAPEFPGGVHTGVLDEGAEAEERFEGFAEGEFCPVLDPSSGLCDLYAERPLACRTFGQPVRVGDDVGVCELCFQGAGDEEIAACAAEIDVDALEAPLLRQFEEGGGAGGRTIVTFALAVGPGCGRASRNSRRLASASAPRQSLPQPVHDDLAERPKLSGVRIPVPVPQPSLELRSRQTASRGQRPDECGKRRLTVVHQKGQVEV